MESIIYKGIRYTRKPNAKDRSDQVYFKANSANAKSKGLDMYLHRQLWIDTYGSIPEGYHIHHKDENPLNNDISNLECLSPQEHSDRHLSEKRSETARQNLDIARSYASEWHKSDEGRKWHSEMAKEAFAKRESVIRTCDQCGKEFDSITYRDSDRFCSNNCKSAWRRDSGIDNVDKICPRCGQTFSTNKYNPKKYCSRDCKFPESPYPGVYFREDTQCYHVQINVGKERVYIGMYPTETLAIAARREAEKRLNDDK